MKSKWFKLLSIMIIMVIVFHASAQTVYGIIEVIPNENKKEEEYFENEEKYNVDTEEEVKILYEDVSKRERNIKHFFTDKGTYQAVIYPSSVHYEANGKWEDIDNTLTSTINENGEEVTQNAKNSFRVEFSNNIKENIFSKQDVLPQREVLKEKDKLAEQDKLNEKDSLREEEKLIEQEELTEQDNLKEEELIEQEELTEQDNLKEEELIEQEELTEQDNLKEEELIEQEELIEKENLKEEQLLNEEDIQIEKIDKRKNINEFKIVSIVSDKFSMKWYMEGTNRTKLRQIEKIETKAKSEIETKAETKELNKEKIEQKNVSAAVTYSNIMDDVDLDYDVSSDYVKETIVLKSLNAVRDAFVFNMDMGDSTLILNEDNSIDILDDRGEKVALIEIPYMYDSKMEYSTDIKVILEKDESLESNTYRMEIIPSFEWLQDEERVYPVKIDPTVTTSLYAQYIEDTSINSGNIYATGGPNDIALKVGKGADGVHRSLIKFQLPTLKAGDQVISAGLSIFGFFDTWPWWNPPPPHGQMNVHKITSPWSVSTACWANSSEIYDSSRVSAFNLYEYSDEYWWAENIWDITDIAKDWYTTGNYGLMLKENDESGSVQHDPAFYISSDVEDDLKDVRPMAIIEYRNQAGLENYLSYHEQDLGRAGTGYVNDYNGNLTITHPDAVTPGSRMPASINHVYNTNDISRDWGFGIGWKLNITQMINIEMMQVYGEDVEYAKYLDEDGTIHYFIKDGSSNIYYEEDGLGLTLTKNADLSFTMEDKAGNMMIFERQVLSGKDWWHLKEIKDVNGNKITISLSNNGSLFYPGTVTDGAGTVIKINWTNGRVSSIVDQAGRTTSYTYDGNGRLIKIKYPDLKEVNYTYDSKGLLLSAKNIDNSHIDYTYYQTVPYRVNTVKEYSTNNEIGNSLDISYGNNCSNFTDNRGYKIIYTFNNWGNLINISDYGDNVNDINNAYGKSYAYGINGSGATNKLTFESTVMAVDEDVISVNNLVKNPGFENGLTGWTRNSDCNTNIDTVVNTSKGNALVLNGELWKYKEVTQTVNVSGGKGDVFSFSAWVKNTGVLNLGGIINLLEASGGGGNVLLLPNVVDNGDDWQYVSGVFITTSNYNGIDICISSHSQANQMWVKNISLVKDEGGQSYSYDEKGNLISTQDLAKQNSEFKYSNGNELIKQTNPKGGSYVYEYDFQYKNRLTKAINNSRVGYSFEYDNYGNTTSSKISNNYETTSWITNGGIYYIRAKSSGLYLKTNIATTGVDQALLNTETNQQWKISSTNDGYYEIKSVADGTLLESSCYSGYVEACVRTGADNQKWKLELSSDGSFVMKPKTMENVNAATMENDSTEKGVLLAEQKFEGKATQYFYFQEVETALEQEFIESGEVYYLKNAYTQGYLDYKTQTDTNNTSMVQQNYNDSDSQKWRIMRNENGTYRLVSLFSKTGKALTNSNSNGNTTVIYDYDENNTNQEWIINRQTDGKFIISSKSTSRNLAINNNTNNIGEAVITANSAGDISKYWVLEPTNMVDIEDGATYKIKNKNSGLYVGVNDNTNNVEQQVGNSGQEWIFTKLNNGYYTINWKDWSIYTLSVEWGVISIGTNVIIQRVWWDEYDSSQRWEIVPVGDGSFYLKPEVTYGVKALDVAGGSTGIGANIQIYQTNGTAAQHFYLEKVAEPNQEYIESKAEYTQDGRFLNKLIDTRGKETTYEYNFDNQTKTGTGTLQSTIDAKGNTTEYMYDNLDRLTNVSLIDGNNVYQNQYQYTNDKLTKITHNGFDINFVYDNWGNRKSVGIGNQNLITNNYAANNRIIK